MQRSVSHYCPGYIALLHAFKFHLQSGSSKQLPSPETQQNFVHYCASLGNVALILMLCLTIVAEVSWVLDDEVENSEYCQAVLECRTDNPHWAWKSIYFAFQQ